MNETWKTSEKFYFKKRNFPFECENTLFLLQTILFSSVNVLFYFLISRQQVNSQNVWVAQHSVIRYWNWVVSGSGTRRSCPEYWRLPHTVHSAMVCSRDLVPEYWTQLLLGEANYDSAAIIHCCFLVLSSVLETAMTSSFSTSTRRNEISFLKPEQWSSTLDSTSSTQYRMKKTNCSLQIFGWTWWVGQNKLLEYLLEFFSRICFFPSTIASPSINRATKSSVIRL